MSTQWALKQQQQSNEHDTGILSTQTLGFVSCKKFSPPRSRMENNKSLFPHESRTGGNLSNSRSLSPQSSAGELAGNARRFPGMLSAPRYLTGNFRKLGKHGHRALPVVILGSRGGDRRSRRGEGGAGHTRREWASLYQAILHFCSFGSQIGHKKYVSLV